MALVWWVSERIRNAGIVDIAWSALFTPLAILYAALGQGWAPRRLAVAAAASVWSVRLAWHLYRRVMGRHPREDRRYVELRRRFGGKFFAFFEAQGLLAALLSTPFALAAMNETRGFHAIEIAGYALLIVAGTGETIADAQLARFKATANRDDAVCRVGLWRTSRHPNYFFEWLVWCAFFLMALPAPGGWISLFCPVLMLYFLLRVTGIPMLEEQAVATKGDAYRAYQRSTSAFVPWFTRDES